MKPSFQLSFIAILLTCVGAVPPLTGPLLARPTNLNTSSIFDSATANLTSLLEHTVVDSKFAGFDINETSFSIAVTSFSAPDRSPVLWDFHHLSPNRSANATNTINGDSQYIIASISKVFTDLLVLKSDLNLNASITDYLTELNDFTALTKNSTILSSAIDSPNVPWSTIKVSDLTSHLSSLPQNFGFPEIYQLIPLYQALGFPPVSPSDFPSCGVIGLNPGCSASDLLSGLINSSHAVLPAGSSPAYNNVAFNLLGMILERRYNATFASLVDSWIVRPLGLTNTGIASDATDSKGVIPSSASSWKADFGINVPAGGLYSSTNDLVKLAHHILDHSPLILPTVDRIDRWLKPVSFLSAPNRAVGAPWEIYRTSTLVGHNVDIYAKDGGLQAYSTRLILIPEYGVGMVILSAGPDSGKALTFVSEATVAGLTPAVDSIARIQANETYGGLYTADDNGHPDTIMSNNTSSTNQNFIGGGSGTIVDANVTLTIDDGIGIRVQSMWRNGSDMLDALATIYNQGLVVPGRLSREWRIYPTGLNTNSTVKLANGTIQDVVLEDWRLGFENIPSTADDTDKDTESDETLEKLAGVRGVFADAVSAWQGLDAMYYGGQAVDRFVFVRERNGVMTEKGKVVGLRLPALRLDLIKG